MELRSIWKFPLLGHRNDVAMPAGSHVLHVNSQGPDGELFLWADVDTTAPMSTRRFLVVPTGGAPKGAYVGTVLVLEGAIVLHVYEVTP